VLTSNGVDARLRSERSSPVFTTPYSAYLASRAEAARELRQRNRLPIAGCILVLEDQRPRPHSVRIFYWATFCRSKNHFSSAEALRLPCGMLDTPLTDEDNPTVIPARRNRTA
jgi:hypothetical protein